MRARLSPSTVKGRVTLKVQISSKASEAFRGKQNGGIVQQEAAMDISNVMLVVDGQVTRVGFSGEGRSKVRIIEDRQVVE